MLPTIPDALEDSGAARAEAFAAQAAYRKRVRTASMAIVFGLAAVIALNAILPTTRASDQAGLLLTAGLILVVGASWFVLLPRGVFPRGRVFIAAAIAQGVMIIMLGLTGGVPSVYFPYYVLPVLVMILSGRWRQAVVQGALAAVGVVGLALSVPYSDLLRDVTVTRLLQVGTMTFFAAATALATGETQRALAARTATLATQRDDAFHMAVTDELTGLYNRHYMRDALRRMTAHATRRDQPFAIVSLDVDGLKSVNDAHGHHAGDALLRGIADSLRAVLRSEDIAVRVGGDEFVVLLPDADRGEAVKVAYRIRQRIASLDDPGRGVSSGIAVWRRGTDPEDALRQADDELYRAKAARTSADTG
jgi:diguanylate cyclase (GGDEF)-like protein